MVLKSFFCVLFFISNVYAQQAPSGQSTLGSFFPLIVIFGIFYFLLIRPQQRKAKDHQSMLNALKKDDKIITNGGIYGVVTGVKGEVIEVKIAEGVKVNISKAGVSTVVFPDNKAVTPEVVKQ